MRALWGQRRISFRRYRRGTVWTSDIRVLSKNELPCTFLDGKFVWKQNLVFRFQLDFALRQTRLYAALGLHIWKWAYTALIAATRSLQIKGMLPSALLEPFASLGANLSHRSEQGCCPARGGVVHPARGAVVHLALGEPLRSLRLFYTSLRFAKLGWQKTELNL